MWTCERCNQSFDEITKRYYTNTGYVCWGCSVPPQGITLETVLPEKMTPKEPEYQGHPYGTPPREGIGGYYIDPATGRPGTPVVAGPSGPMGVPGPMGCFDSPGPQGLGCPNAIGSPGPVGPAGHPDHDVVGEFPDFPVAEPCDPDMPGQYIPVAESYLDPYLACAKTDPDTAGQEDYSKIPPDRLADWLSCLNAEAFGQLIIAVAKRNPELVRIGLEVAREHYFPAAVPFQGECSPCATVPGGWDGDRDAKTNPDVSEHSLPVKVGPDESGTFVHHKTHPWKQTADIFGRKAPPSNPADAELNYMFQNAQPDRNGDVFPVQDVYLPSGLPIEVGKALVKARIPAPPTGTPEAVVGMLDMSTVRPKGQPIKKPLVFEVDSISSFPVKNVLKGQRISMGCKSLNPCGEVVLPDSGGIAWSAPDGRTFQEDSALRELREAYDAYRKKRRIAEGKSLVESMLGCRIPDFENIPDERVRNAWAQLQALKRLREEKERRDDQADALALAMQQYPGKVYYMDKVGPNDELLKQMSKLQLMYPPNVPAPNQEERTSRILQALERTPEEDRQARKLQLIQSGQISEAGGLKAVGIDFHEEVKRMMADQQFQAEQQQQLQEQMADAEHQKLIEQAAQAEEPLFKDIHDPLVPTDAFDQIVSGVAIGHLQPTDQQMVIDTYRDFHEAQRLANGKMLMKIMAKLKIELPPEITQGPPVLKFAEFLKEEMARVKTLKEHVPLDLDQFFVEMTKHLVGNNAVHFQTGPGYSGTAFRERVVNRMTQEARDTKDIRAFSKAWFATTAEFRNEGKINRDYTDYVYRRIIPPFMEQPDKTTVLDCDQEPMELPEPAQKPGPSTFEKINSLLLQIAAQKELPPDDADQSPTDTPVRINDDGSVAFLDEDEAVEAAIDAMVLTDGNTDEVMPEFTGDDSHFRPCTDNQREEAFARKIIPPIPIQNNELDRSIPSPPFAWRDGQLVTVDVSDFSKECLAGMLASEWDEISQELRVLTVPPYANEESFCGNSHGLVKRTEEEKNAEIRRLNQAAGYQVE